MKQLIITLFLITASLSGCLGTGDTGDESSFEGHYHGYDFSFGLDFDEDTGEFIVYPRFITCPEDLEAESQSMMSEVETDIHPLGSVLVENDCIYLNYRPSMYGFVWNYSSSDYVISDDSQLLEITFPDQEFLAETLLIGTNGAFLASTSSTNLACSFAGGTVPGVPLSGDELLEIDEEELENAIESHLSVFTNSSIMNDPRASSCVTSQLGMQAWLEYANEDNTDGDLALFAFDAQDSQGSPSNGTNDSLVMVTMTQGGDLNWASLSVQVSVNDSAPITCDNPEESGGECQIVEFGNTDDQVWSVGDGVTLYENGLDICSDVCSLDIKIVDTREGKVIYEFADVLAE
jgi:hypothetical protein